MKTITLLDTKTGQKLTIEALDSPDTDDYWWSEGNGGCDCNRAPYFGIEEDGPDGPRYCAGHARILIVGFTGECKLTLRELNSGYPKELVDAHLPPE